MRLAWTVTVVASVLPIAARMEAQQTTAPVAPPPYESLRYDEDWSALRNPNVHFDAFDPLKYIRLGDHGNYLSLGGEVRETWERFHNDFGLSDTDPQGYLLQRYLFHADLHIGEHFRVFTQFQSGIENFRVGGPRSVVDGDKLDANQAFVDIAPRASTTNGAVLRVGRQEIQLGSGRLVARREGTNTLFSFDGARLILPFASWQIDLFAARPVLTNPGFFDDVQPRMPENAPS